jgi:hypothetical protein
VTADARANNVVLEVENQKNDSWSQPEEAKDETEKLPKFLFTGSLCPSLGARHDGLVWMRPKSYTLGGKDSVLQGLMACGGFGEVGCFL